MTLTQVGLISVSGRENEGISYKRDHGSSPWTCVWREVLGLIFS